MASHAANRMEELPSPQAVHMFGGLRLGSALGLERTEVMYNRIHISSRITVEHARHPAALMRAGRIREKRPKPHGVHPSRNTGETRTQAGWQPCFDVMTIGACQLVKKKPPALP